MDEAIICEHICMNRSVKSLCVLSWVVSASDCCDCVLVTVLVFLVVRVLGAVFVVFVCVVAEAWVVALAAGLILGNWAGS